MCSVIHLSNFTTILLLQGNPLPGTDILLLWLFGSLGALHFHYCLGKPLPGLLILQDCLLLQPAAEPKSLHSSLLFYLCTAPPAAAEYVCPAIQVVGPAPPPIHCPWLAIPWEGPVAPPTLLICCPSIHVADAGAPPSQWKDLCLLPATGPDSWQPPAVSGPVGRLDQSSQPSYLIYLFTLFSLPFLNMNSCYVRRNELLFHISFYIRHTWTFT